MVDIDSELMVYYSYKPNVNILYQKVSSLPVSFDELKILKSLLKGWDFLCKPKEPFSNGFMALSMTNEDMTIFDQLYQSRFLLTYSSPDHLITGQPPYYFISPLIDLFDRNQPKCETYINEKNKLMRLFK